MGTMVDSWFDAFMLGFTLVTAALQLYTLVLEVKISPKEMRTYRWFLCICMVNL
jgi:hydrogenase/urease accessory protein HupE